MKKLICAAVVAASTVVMAEETSAVAPAAPAAVPAAVAPAQPAVAHPKLTDEQRAKMREQREKFMAERKAAMEAKLLEVIKKYVSDEEKAKALLKELQETMVANRRNIGFPRRPMSAPKATEAK